MITFGEVCIYTTHYTKFVQDRYICMIPDTLSDTVLPKWYCLFFHRRVFSVFFKFSFPHSYVLRDLYPIGYLTRTDEGISSFGNVIKKMIYS